jgi:hypothetical protein
MQLPLAQAIEDGPNLHNRHGERKQNLVNAAQRIFNPTDQIKTIQEVETVICKVKKFKTRLTKNWLSR